MSFVRRLMLAFRLTIGNRAGEGSRPTGAIIGIAIAIVPIIVVVHISDAMISGIAERFIETGTYHLRAQPRFRIDDAEIEHSIQLLDSIDGVEFAAAERTGFGLAYTQNVRTGVQIRAVDARLYQDDPYFRRYLAVEHGEFVLDSERDIVLGRSIAEILAVGVGDDLRILTIRSLPGGGILPRVSTFTIRGIVSTGYQELDRLWVFMRYDRGGSILPPEDASVSIGIKVSHPFALPNDLFTASSRQIDRMENTIQQIYEQLGSAYRLRTWYQEEQSRYMSFNTTRTALLVVMVLIMAVALVNISSSMVLLVLSKQHDIGVLKALGSSPADIRAVFMLVGVWVGMIGATIGTIIGMLISLNINVILRSIEYIAVTVGAVLQQTPVDGSIIGGDFYLETIPVEMLGAELLVIWSAAIMLAIISSIIPAIRASVVRPMEVFYRR